MKANSVFSHFKLTTIVLISITVLGCKNDVMAEHSTSNVSKADYKVEAVEAETNSKMNAPNLPKDLKIIKSARVKYKVTDIKHSTKIFKHLIADYHGYVSDLKFENNLYEKENSFTVKIPAEHFDTILDSISKNVEFIDFEEVSTKDVSEEYIDISRRLQTKKEVRERYETILRQQAKSVKDILDVEDKLRHIQEEIESAQGRINYLNDKVTFSTIQISLYETVTYKEEPLAYEKGFISRTKEGFVFGWEMIQGLLVSMTYVWPFAIVLIVFIGMRKRVYKKIFK